jgi:hypothetical protein
MTTQTTQPVAQSAAQPDECRIPGTRHRPRETPHSPSTRTGDRDNGAHGRAAPAAKGFAGSGGRSDRGCAPGGVDSVVSAGTSSTVSVDSDQTSTCLGPVARLAGDRVERVVTAVKPCPGSPMTTVTTRSTRSSAGRLSRPPESQCTASCTSVHRMPDRRRLSVRRRSGRGSGTLCTGLQLQDFRSGRRGAGRHRYRAST